MESPTHSHCLCLSGESGLGKSTLINSLFLTDLYSPEYPGPSHRIKKTVQVSRVFFCVVPRLFTESRDADASRRNSIPSRAKCFRSVTHEGSPSPGHATFSLSRRRLNIWGMRRLVAAVDTRVFCDCQKLVYLPQQAAGLLSFQNWGGEVTLRFLF